MSVDFSRVKREQVQQALEEFQQMGRSKFMRLVHSKGGAKTWFVEVTGAQKPDLKLIAARAYNLSKPRSKPVRTRQFNTRDARFLIGAKLGFPLIGPGANEDQEIKRDLEKFNPSQLRRAFEEKRRSVRTRQGALGFRTTLLKAYQRCAITGEKTPETLEAAHIIPYAGPSSNHVQNGIILRADLHILFDLNLVQIDPLSYKIEVDAALKGSQYFKYHGKSLKLPLNESHYPAPVALLKRNSIFRTRG